MKKIKYFALIILVSVCALGSNIETLININNKNLEIFSTFYKSVLEGNFEVLENYVRVSENISTDVEKRLMLSEFMKIRKEEFSKLGSFKDKDNVAMSLTSTGENSFSVSFTSVVPRDANSQNNLKSPVIESWHKVSFDGETIDAKQSYLLNMKFKRDSVGWYFHSGSASSAK